MVPHCKSMFYITYMAKRSGTSSGTSRYKSTRSGTKTLYMVFMTTIKVTQKITMSTNQKRQPYAVSKQVNHKIP